MKAILQNEAGQMSVFVALIFQVLFVFFAMVVNIGMAVHDKINLQNAVDLGTYYAAQRQAEILNEIAHINYQIRQDYKLLVWRYRVLGMLGRIGPSSARPVWPPALTPPGTPLLDARWRSATELMGAPEEPSVCLVTEMWSDLQPPTSSAARKQELCRMDYGGRLTPIPSIPIFLSIIPGILAAQASAELAQKNVVATCTQAGALNWAFTMN
ncbi:MAG TPA: Tad domain-containing protein, partial [Bdellovibrionales bacterium]|nr:Tad domain-containing protein [Bdellovibrionales bacterium]